MCPVSSECFCIKKLLSATTPCAYILSLIHFTHMSDLVLTCLDPYLLDIVISLF